MFNFDFSYLSLPKKFYTHTKPDIKPSAKVFILNNVICNKFNFTFDDKQKLISFLCSDINHKKSYAQAYAGHQFGHFTNLGDGRAIIIAEHIN